MGMLYQRMQRDGTIGGPWWIKYCVNNRPIRESTGTTERKKAEAILKVKEGRAAQGLPVLRRVDRISYDEVGADLRRHYAMTGDRNLDEAEDRFKPLDRFFTKRRVVDIDGTLIRRYVEQRQQTVVRRRKSDGKLLYVANNTINNELSVLSRMLKLAYENEKVMRVPIIHRLKGADPRKGFFEAPAFDAVRKHLRPDLQVAVTIAHTFGWRMQSDVLTLLLSQIDLNEGTLRRDPGETKEEGRIVYLTPEGSVYPFPIPVPNS